VHSHGSCIVQLVVGRTMDTEAREVREASPMIYRRSTTANGYGDETQHNLNLTGSAIQTGSTKGPLEAASSLAKKSLCFGSAKEPISLFLTLLCVPISPGRKR
jgi:hypothetical protein